MYPIKDMYEGPRYLLEKAKRDREILTRDLAHWDGKVVPDSVFNFSVTVYHVVDWVKAYKPALEQAAYEWLNSREELGVFRDLSNASKHVKLDLERPPYKKHPPVFDKAKLSATSETIVRAGGQKCRFKIQSKNGTRLAVEEWATRAVNAWDEFFVCNGLYAHCVTNASTRRPNCALPGASCARHFRLHGAAL